MNHQLSIAIHEAGHAVAHVRLGILPVSVTIVECSETFGHSTAEGADSVWTSDGAADQVISYCAGYAASIAAGEDNDAASHGCGDDFEHARRLIEFWALEGDLEAWKARAVALMSSPENVAAVALIADWLMQHGTLDGQLVDVLVDRSDGNVTDSELNRFLALMAGSRGSAA